MLRLMGRMSFTVYFVEKQSKRMSTKTKKKIEKKVSEVMIHVKVLGALCYYVVQTIQSEQPFEQFSCRTLPYARLKLSGIKQSKIC